MSNVNEQVTERQRQPASVRVKDNLFRYGAGTVAAAVLAGYFLQDIFPFIFVIMAGMSIASIAMVLESREQRGKEIKPKDIEDLQMLVMELTHEVKNLPPGYSPSSSKVLESKLEQLEQEVKTLNPRQP
jgi:hypothetical protein